MTDSAEIQKMQYELETIREEISRMRDKFPKHHARLHHLEALQTVETTSKGIKETRNQVFVEYLLDMLDEAWGIIANTGDGNDESGQSEQWEEAVKVWSGKFFQVTKGRK